MSDDPIDDPARGDPGPDAGRDADLGRALAVEPLDDLTRRRLVRGALDDGNSSPVRRARGLAAIGVAASLLVGVVVGAVVVTRPETPATPAAEGSEPKAAADEAVDTAPEAAALAPAQVLGDLGATADVEALARAVDVRLQAGRSGGSEEAAAPLGACIHTAVGGLVLVSATGTATLADRPVVVRVGPAPSGEILVVVLDASDCSVVASAPLPAA